MGLVTLIFDPLTLKLVCESHLSWGTFLPNWARYKAFRFSLYATDEQTDGQKDKSNAYCPLPYGRTRGHNNLFKRTRLPKRSFVCL